jgi:hypothetical protein
MHRHLTRRVVSFSFQCLVYLAIDSGVAWSQTWDGGAGGDNNWGTAGIGDSPTRRTLG